MNAPKTPSKKKAMTEKQYAQIMTKRRACIQKFRETMKKTLKASKKKSTEPVVIQERVPKKRVSNKKNIVSVLSESAVPAVPVKRQRVSKKKKEPLEEPLEEVQSVEEKVVKKRVNKKKTKEPLEEIQAVEEKVVKKRANKKKPEELEEPLEEVQEVEEKVVKKRVYKKKAKEPLEE
jgi:hypothetical protein